MLFFSLSKNCKPKQNQKENIKKRKMDQTFYVPAGLAPLQRELFEILVQLHKNSLLSLLKDPEDELTTRLNSEGNQAVKKGLSDQVMLALLDANLNLVFNHPYLLVEHYMPKKLLLMESHERLMFASDKFAKFDKLLNLLMGLEKNLDLIIVGESVKELDLIEAFILGRDLHYKRYSGAQLYEEKQPIPVAPVVTKKPYENRDDDYVAKVHKKSKLKKSSKLNLHLITSQKFKSFNFYQVTGGDSSSSDNTNETKEFKVDFIISFDEHLDKKNDNIEMIRNLNNDKLIPLIKLLVLNSKTHGMLKYHGESSPVLPQEHLKEGAETEEDLSQDKILLYSSLVTRREDSINKYDEQFGRLLENLKPFFNSPKSELWPISGLPNFKIQNKTDIINSINTDYSFDIFRKFNSDFKTDNVIISDEIDLKEYKILLTKLTIDRIEGIEEFINNEVNSLESKREYCTNEQNNIEDVKVKLGGMFKESKKLEQDLEGIDKTNERLTNELNKYTEINNELKSENEKLNKIISKEIVLNEDDLDKEIEQLTKELNSLTDSNTALSSQIDSLRTEYQHITTTAAEKSNLVKSLTAENTALTSKLNGPGLKLRQLQNEDAQIVNAETIKRLNKNLVFLQRYNSNLNDVVKQRISSLPVGRNGRLYRSTTPF